MAVIEIIGGQWGDEGKGKIVELMARKADLVVRFSGGSNAGHTVINQYGTFGLHLVPSGIFYSGVKCLLGNGVVVDPAILIQEMESLNSRGISTSNLFISERAHLVMPYHLLLDGLEEEARGAGAIGTTRRGIGPAFVDKTARQGIRVADLLDKKVFFRRLSQVMQLKNVILTKVYGAQPLSVDEVYKQYLSYARTLAPHITDTQRLVDEALERKDFILLEGAQGTLLDPDFGTYPYVTSSSPMAGGGCQGSGIGPKRIDRIIGIFKAYNTRVGSGAMPTELDDETGELIREIAHEFGTTTGRPRRCGWFDAVAGAFSVRINSFTGLAITRLDVLDALPQIKICTGYHLDGKLVRGFPTQLTTLEKCQPVYEEMPGWLTPTSDIRRYRDLPLAARRYLRKMEELLSCPVDIVSVGARREETIIIKPIP
ncbi:MAG: adenylosuccinate synthase [Dehalococcoidia bacterium]|nr:adenylosuccinate synthase [Dehalococcoidia bacterium]